MAKFAPRWQVDGKGDLVDLKAPFPKSPLTELTEPPSTVASRSTVSSVSEVLGNADEKTPPADFTDRTDRISSPAPYIQPEGVAERAAIMQYDGGLPRKIAEGLARLDDTPCPAGIPPGRWQSVKDAAGRFADQWGAEAVKHGWPMLDLFGADPDAPWTRIDRLGLIFLVAGGRVVTSIDPDRIALRTAGGAVHTFCPGDRGRRVFVWEFG